jgi:protein TonB
VVQADRVYSAAEVDTSPQLIHRVPPQYTESAHKAGIQGTVRLEAEIWPDGKAHNIRVVNGVGDAGLDQSAVRALSQWRFAAGRKGGQPVKVRALIDLSFRLEGGGRRPGLSLEKKNQ